MKRIALVAPLLLALAGCDAFYAEADQPLTCLTLPEQSFSILVGGSSITGPYDVDSPAWPVTITLGNALPGFIVKGSADQHAIHILSIGASLKAGQGTTFDWLKSLQFSVVPPGAAPVVVAQYAGGLPAGATSFNLASSNTGYNIFSALQDGSVQFNLQGHVTVPAGQTIPSTWTATVNACFNAHVKTTLQDLTK